MAIRWMVSAWEEVPSEVTSKCFKHVGMYLDKEMEMDDDRFAGVELLEIEELLSHISPDLDVSFADVEVDTPEPPVNTTLPNWRGKCVISSGHQRRLKRVMKSPLRSLKN